MSHSVLNTIVWILSVYMSWFLPLLCPCLSPDPGQNWVCCDLLNHTPWPKGRQSSNSISVPGYKEKIDYWYHTCVCLNSMSRNSLDQLVAVSNPIPSSLRRQNLSWHYSSGTGCPSFSASLDFHFLISHDFPQLFLRAKLITLFLIPECAQHDFRFNREEFHVSIRLPMHIDFL